MSRRLIAITVGSFAACALIGWFVATTFFGSSSASTVVDGDPPFASQPPERADDTVVVSYIVDPHETIVGTTAVVPVEAGADDDSFDLRFELAPFGPRAEVEALAEEVGTENFFVDDEFLPLYLKDWVMETSVGPVAGSITRPGINVVRFPVEQGFSTAAVEEIVVTRYLVGMPLQSSFILSVADPLQDLYPGVSINLRHRSDQDGSTIVQVEVDAALPLMTSWFGIRGEGSGWRSSVREAEGGPRWTLTWIGNDLPDEIPLSVVGMQWLEGSEPLHISIDGLR